MFRGSSANSTAIFAGEMFAPTEWRAMGRRLGLTDREVEVVRAMFDYRTELDMAQALGCKPDTLHTHVRRIYDKLGVKSRVEVVLAAVACSRTLISRSPFMGPAPDQSPSTPG